MTITIENIGGKQHTVVWHEEQTNGYVLQELVWGYAKICRNRGIHIATALPALPRNPKPEDAKLLYRYMAEGIVFYFVADSGSDDHPKRACYNTQDHSTVCDLFYGNAHLVCATINGERVEIAIED